MKISNLSDAEFKTLVIRMFKELAEDLDSIKKIQSGENKDGSVVDTLRLLAQPELTENRTARKSNTK